MNYSDIIIAPIITEKSNTIMSENKYTFKVSKTANKIEIGKAIEALFNVKVVDVNTLNVKPKKKRVGRHIGKTSAYKKAIVTLSKESKIEII